MQDNKRMPALTWRGTLAMSVALLGVWSCQVATTQPTLDTEKTLNPGKAQQTNTLRPNAPKVEDNTVVRSPIRVSDEVKSAFPEGPEAVLEGTIVDQFGMPAVNVPVKSALETVTTDATGHYQVKVPSGPDVHVRFAANSDAFVFADEYVSVFPNETLKFDTELLALDSKVTPVKAGEAAVVGSSDVTKVLRETASQRREYRNSFGLLQSSQADVVAELEAKGIPAVQLTIPEGALLGDARVRLSWLNPLPRPGKPNGDLYGPLETYTEWVNNEGQVRDESVPLTPVNFADINLGGASIAPGAELTIKWVVGPEVLDKYPIEMSNGQAFLPCYTYDQATRTWAIPVLARVFTENGYTWAEYKMRNSTPPQVTPESAS